MPLRRIFNSSGLGAVQGKKGMKISSIFHQLTRTALEAWARSSSLSIKAPLVA